MGLAVAKALANRGGWHLHLLDLNAERGEQAAKDVPKSTFHKTNVTSYDSLANVFQSVFDTEGRLDFVFANAGIVERFNFYDSHPTGKPPPPPDQTVIDINLKSVIDTVWLAQHYFRQSTQSDNKNLVMTASVGGLYRCQVSPSYCAAKHGVVGLMRSIANHFYKHDGVRVNAICPGTVRTNLLDQTAWSTFSDDVFVPIQKIVSTVSMLIDGSDVGGKDIQDGKPLGKAVNGAGAGEKLNGKAVELSGTNHYYRDQYDYCDPHMEKCMKATERETYQQ
jgi:NAD(P)-dependent dehydrogenase (short-subunit alcohol dehydrogenase family)